MIMLPSPFLPSSLQSSLPSPSLPSSFLTFLPPLTPSWAAFLFPTLSSMAFLVQCDPRCAKAWPNHRQPCQKDHHDHNHHHQCDPIIANLSPLDNAWWEIWSLYGVEWDVVWYSKVVEWSGVVWYVAHTMYYVHPVIKSTVWFSKQMRLVLIMVCCMVWLGMVWLDLLRDTHSFVRFMSHSLSTDR